MKKLTIGITLVFITGNLIAQNNPVNNVANQEETPVAVDNTVLEDDDESTDESNLLIDTSLPNGLMLAGTRMVMVKDGIVTPMDKDMVFPNGTRVTTRGYIYRKNKPKLLLNIDEYVDTSGKILPMNSTNSSINPLLKIN